MGKLYDKILYKLGPRWALDPELFGSVGADIWDFEAFNYNFFLDNVK